MSSHGLLAGKTRSLGYDAMLRVVHTPPATACVVTADRRMPAVERERPLGSHPAAVPNFSDEVSGVGMIAGRAGFYHEFERADLHPAPGAVIS